MLYGKTELSSLTVIRITGKERRVVRGPAERSKVSIEVMAPGEGALTVLRCGRRIRRFAGAGAGDAPSGPGVDRGSEVVRSRVDGGCGAVDGGDGRGVRGFGLAFVVDLDPDSGRVDMFAVAFGEGGVIVVGDGP